MISLLYQDASSVKNSCKLAAASYEHVLTVAVRSVTIHSLASILSLTVISRMKAVPGSNLASCRSTALSNP